MERRNEPLVGSGDEACRGGANEYAPGLRQCTRPTRARHIHPTCTRCARACERNFLTIDLTQNNSII